MAVKVGDKLPQAFITNTSLTETQAMVSTPLALSAAASFL